MKYVLGLVAVCMLFMGCDKAGEEILPEDSQRCTLRCFTGFNERVDYGFKAKPVSGFPDGELYWSAYQYGVDGTPFSKGGEVITSPDFNVILEAGKETFISVWGIYRTHDALTALSDFFGQKKNIANVELYTGGAFCDTVVADSAINIPCSIYNGVVSVRYYLPNQIISASGAVYTDLTIKSFWKVKPEIKIFSGVEVAQNKSFGIYIVQTDETEQLSGSIDPYGSVGCVYSKASRGTLGFAVFSGDVYLQDLSVTINVEEGVCKLVNLNISAKRQIYQGKLSFDSNVPIISQDINESVRIE